MIRNPKNVKQEIKLAFFYIIDAGIVAGMLFLANYLLKIIPLGGFGTIMFYLVFGVLGIFLCVKPFSSPTDRNIKVIWNMLKMDNRNYHPIEIETINSTSASKRK